MNQFKLKPLKRTQFSKRSLNWPNDRCRKLKSWMLCCYISWMSKSKHSSYWSSSWKSKTFNCELSRRKQKSCRRSRGCKGNSISENKSDLRSMSLTRTSPSWLTICEFKRAIEWRRMCPHSSAAHFSNIWISDHNYCKATVSFKNSSAISVNSCPIRLHWSE